MSISAIRLRQRPPRGPPLRLVRRRAAGAHRVDRPHGKPIPFGNPTDNTGPSTTHLTVTDRDGNVVSYTFTIEQTGGSGIVVPGYGFLLNNELTDFGFAPVR